MSSLFTRSKSKLLSSTSQSSSRNRLVPPSAPSSTNNKNPLTPRSLTNAGIIGETKRSEVLENQLKEVSLTASNAYDKIDEVETENHLLHEQVNKQKLMISGLLAQLDKYAEGTRASVSSSGTEDSVMSNGSSSSSSGTSIDESNVTVSEKDQMIQELNKTIKSLKQDQLRQAKIINQQRDSIDSLNNEIKALKSNASDNIINYQTNLNELSKSLLLINENKRFLNNRKIPERIDTQIANATGGYKDLRLSKYSPTSAQRGETFVLPVPKVL